MNRLPNWLKAAIITGAQSALGTFIFTLLGWFHEVQEWAGDTEGKFPAVTPLGKAAVSLAVGVVVGVLTAIYRQIKPVEATYTNTPPEG